MWSVGLLFTCVGVWQASTVVLVAGKDVSIAAGGSINANGLAGTGGIAAGAHSSGGSHGGAGGRLPCSIQPQKPCCSGAFFSVSVPGQTMIGDPVDPLSQWADAYGSGGGPGGGAGGGRVYVSAANRLTVNGYVSADGQPTESSVGGSGAGGTVVINASQVDGVGPISADGGQGSTTKALAAGGGGRVAVTCHQLSMQTSQITAMGGSTTPDSTANKCLEGGTGTVFISQTGANFTNGVSRTLQVGNNNLAPTYAMTPLNISMEAGITTLQVNNGAIAGIANFFVRCAAAAAHCDLDVHRDVACVCVCVCVAVPLSQMPASGSGITVNSGVISSLGSTVPMHIIAPVVDFQDGTMISGGSSVRIQCHTFTVSDTSSVSYQSDVTIFASRTQAHGRLHAPGVHDALCGWLWLLAQRA